MIEYQISIVNDLENQQALIAVMNSCTEENCTKTIQTFDGPQEIEVPCDLAD